MRAALKKFLKQCKRLKYSPVVKLAPTWIHTFDRIVVVYVDVKRSSILNVYAYDTKTDELRKCA
jgi:hypothetical protein